MWPKAHVCPVSAPMSPPGSKRGLGELLPGPLKPDEIEADRKQAAGGDCIGHRGAPESRQRRQNTIHCGRGKRSNERDGGYFGVALECKKRKAVAVRRDAQQRC